MCKINAQQLRAASIFSSKDETRPILCTVNVKTKGEDYTIASTDTYRLFVVGEKANIDGSGYSISAYYPKNLKAADETVELEPFDDSHVMATITNKRGQERKETWELIEGSFPKWRNIIPTNEEPCTNWGINPDYMADAMKALKMATKSNVVSTHTTSPLKPIVFRAKGQDVGSAMALVMPIRLS